MPAEVDPHMDVADEANELVLEAALSKEQINCFLKLIKSAHCGNGEPHEFPMYYCLLMDWATDLLKHPGIGLHFVFDAVCLFKFNGSTFVHFVDELWTAAKFWNVQSRLPPDGKVLPFILYADKVKLSSFGWQKGYPVVTQLANLPTWIWNGEGIRGGRIVGWLPINAVWHHSFKKLLETIEKESQTGCWVNCWDGIACFMALVHGVKSNFPCPVCLIPCDNISKFPAQCELCTSDNVVKVLQEAHSQETAEKGEQILIWQGLCDVDNAFLVVANMDVYHALLWDWLHANFAGKFGNHLWSELLRIFDKGVTSFSVMPRWHGLNHFDEALSVSYTDGQKFEDLSKVWLYHTGWEALTTFNTLMQKFSEKTKNTKKNWNFPKNHTCAHAFNDIEVKGVTCNFSTKPNEKMHGPLKEKYQRHMNFKNVADQILDIDHLELVSEFIHCRITDYDMYISNEEIIGNDDTEQEDFFHVKLGSKTKHLLTLEAAKLNEFLNRYFTVVGKPLPGGKPIQFPLNAEITEYKYIRVNFESVVDWCQYTDHLECNPNFHGHSCYDCDIHLNLWRVCEQPCESAKFFSVQLIIHGVLLCPDHT
ncbi:hypothetical protein BKA83DRAFT_4464009 [Pisolithus microcarpus]|nr:hypothetical protein BKA83DRAFT_4464009 [Pisolithus microcarpus]